MAVYATFLNRAFDQVLMDVALHKAGVTFVLDRAGVTGPTAPSHNGMWDLSILQVVPGSAGRRAAGRRDAAGASCGRRSRSRTGRPWCATPRASVGPEIPAVRRVGGVDVLRRAARPDGEGDC